MITTVSHKCINPYRYTKKDVDITDIAHHLACINRFCGALPTPVNVAQHSVYVSWLVAGTGDELQGLLHDAAEYVLGDMTKLFKGSPEMEPFRRVEDDIQKTIYQVYNCRPKMTATVKNADRLACRFEAHCYQFPLQHPDYGPLNEEEFTRVSNAIPTTRWFPWDWTIAKREFLKRFEELTQ